MNDDDGNDVDNTNDDDDYVVGDDHYVVTATMTMMMMMMMMVVVVVAMAIVMSMAMVMVLRPDADDDDDDADDDDDDDGGGGGGGNGNCDVDGDGHGVATCTVARMACQASRVDVEICSCIDSIDIFAVSSPSCTVASLVASFIEHNPDVFVALKRIHEWESRLRDLLFQGRGQLAVAAGVAFRTDVP
ncbi:hypothetical protein AK812_SmicGene8924 [Symbiodinium microadriaticum]|uniref:Uncharacterized protein n=1 Tax=Symbiodinium microadriaticum TaxID=2951 RepID=A0A1Q9EJR0_SYMMI|nr:hypothetical protein AK812_SmicGene8924 [Symbiodinium microadriaticum]